MELGLGGKTAIVTGASFGLGRVTALALSREGANIALCGRRFGAVETAAQQIQNETGVAALACRADVRQPADIARFVEATVDRFGTVDILINNADSGGHDPESFFEVSDEAWMARFEVKLFAAIRLSRLVAPLMMERGWGRIINITSPTTHRMTANNGGWTKGASQAGIVNLTKRLSNFLGAYGITVNAIEPGRMNDLAVDAVLSTESQEDAQIARERIEQAASAESLSYEEMDRRLVSGLVIGRRIEFEDTANLITFFASERAATITGEVILADGGQNPSVRY